MIRNTKTGNLLLFPNPVKQVVTIRSAEPILRLSITGIYGRAVQQLGPLHQTVMQLNVTDYPPGIYLLRVNGKTDKLVKE